MKKINPDKVYAEYRDDIDKASPVKERKYTVTHSDTTGNLFVTIGLEYAKDKLTSMRDEVLLEWRIHPKKSMLYGKVLVDGEGVEGSPFIRNMIFKKEMGTALQAVRYADRALFEKYPDLDKLPIYIDFISSSPEFNKLNYFGNMQRYRI